MTTDYPNPSVLAEVTARVEAAGIPYNKTDDGYLLHNSQNGVLLRLVN